MTETTTRTGHVALRRGQVYDYCQCGAVRKIATGSDRQQWHICQLCFTGLPCSDDTTRFGCDVPGCAVPPSHPQD